MMGISDVKQQMIVWSIPTTIAWAIGGTGVALLNLLFGSGGTWFDPCCRCWCWRSSSGTSGASPWRRRPVPCRAGSHNPQRHGNAVGTRASLLNWPSFYSILQRSVGCLLLPGGTGPPVLRCSPSCYGPRSRPSPPESPASHRWCWWGLVLFFCGAGALPFWRRVARQPPHLAGDHHGPAARSPAAVHELSPRPPCWRRTSSTTSGPCASYCSPHCCCRVIP